MTENDHLSVTQMKTYLRCPLQYFFSYVCDVKPPANGAMALGRAVHSALEHNYRQKIKTGEDLPLEELQGLYDGAWDEAADEAFFEKNEKPSELKDQGAGLLDVYHREIAPGVQPVDVERRFLVDVPGVELPLLGYIDLIDDQGVIIDHKTAGRSYQQDAVDRDIQLTAYALAYRSMFGEPENGLRMDVLVKTKTPKAQRISTARTEDDIRRFARLAQQVEQAINAEVYYPNEGFLCNGCRYEDMCGGW